MKIKPSILRESIDCKSPVILYDYEVIEENLKRFRALSSSASATWSIAVKALAREEVMDLAKDYVDGFDISNLREWKLVKESFTKAHKIWFTNGNLEKELDRLLEEVPSQQLLVTVNDLYDFSFIKDRKLSYLIRLRSSDLIKQDRQSRFGMSLSDVFNLRDELLKDKSFVGFHVHQGLEDHKPALLKEMITSIKDQLKDFSHQGLTFNIGGSFQEFSDEEIRDCLLLLENDFAVHMEPGRALYKGAGSALAPVEKFFVENDELRVFTRLSFICHLKWAKPRFAGILNLSENLQKCSPRKLILEGPTCYEFDRSEALQIDDDLSLGKGSLILLENVSGYASEWNKGFNGIPVCEIKFVGRRRRDNPS